MHGISKSSQLRTQQTTDFGPFSRTASSHLATRYSDTRCSTSSNRMTTSLYAHAKNLQLRIFTGLRKVTRGLQNSALTNIGRRFACLSGSQRLASSISIGSGSARQNNAHHAAAIPPAGCLVKDSEMIQRVLEDVKKTEECGICTLVKPMKKFKNCTHTFCEKCIIS